VQNIKDILKLKSFRPDTRNKYEFQAYGNRLAEELGDMPHRSLYIKLAKTVDRNMLEVAREYVLRSEKAVTKGKLFMWKLAELKKGRESKDKSQAPLKTSNKP